MIFIVIIFWLSVFLVFHSYLFYPLLLSLFVRKKKIKSDVFTPENLPFASVIIPMFNEEEVIARKIQSIYDSEYPTDRFEILAGSDNSTDNTNSIVQKISKHHSNLRFFPFMQRQGKGNIVNRLAKEAKGNILLLTDANVIFDKNTFFHLVKHFKNPEIGLVDSNMINVGLKKEGISFQERAYISREVRIKHRESILWGTMMGPFGGCYAIRKEVYSEVPSNFLVDDFYINMKVLEKGMKTINDPEAMVYEDVSNSMKEEFRRKIRIATGNFQNFMSFRHLLFPLYTGLSFSFLSHKAIRWFGPFLIIFAFIMNLILALNNDFYLFLFYCQIFLFILPFIDYVLKKMKIHIVLLRFPVHFYLMNLALLIGYFKFRKGVKSNVWQPTQRNQ